MVLTKLSEQSTYEWVSANFIQNLIILCSLLFAVGAAIRLARFNISVSDKNYFNGLPTPAAALVIASIWLIINTETTIWISKLIWNIYFVFFVLILLVFLMVSKIRMISLKFDGFGLKTNAYRYIILIVGVILFIFFGLEGILYTMVLYLLLSLSMQLIKTS